MAGNVYRFDPAVMLPVPGPAVFAVAAAAFVFATALPQPVQAERVRYQPPPFRAAVFLPPDPIYVYAGNPVQAVASYPYRAPQDARREWQPLEPWFGPFATATPPFPYASPNPQTANLRPAESRSKVVSGWFAVFAPPDPVYNFTGRTGVQSRPYSREDVGVRLASYAIQAPAAALPYPALNQAAAYLRAPETRAEWLDNLAPWFSSFAPPDPFYPFSGRVVQPTAPYRRDHAFPQLSVKFAISAPAPAPVPYVALPYVRQATESRVEWLDVSAWFGTFAPPDPVYAFAGPVVQRVGTYQRPTAPVQLGPAYALPPTPAAAVPAQRPQPLAAFLRDTAATIDVSPNVPIATPAAAPPLVAPSSRAAYLRERWESAPFVLARAKVLAFSTGITLLDDARIYTLAAVDRTYTLAAVDRTYTLAATDRGYMLVAIDRTFTEPEPDA